MPFAAQSNACGGGFVCGCDCMGGFSYKTQLSSLHSALAFSENVTKPDL